MEPSTTILKMLHGNEIFIPNYQRAYSWEVPRKSDDTQRQVETFLKDLQEYVESKANTPYYFGHFLYEKNPQSEDKYGIVDGQQRLTTIIIFLSVLFEELKKIKGGNLDEKQRELYEDTIKRGSTYHFETVAYDDQSFKDYIINRVKKYEHKEVKVSGRKIKVPDTEGSEFETDSIKKIIYAFDYFTIGLENKDELALIKLLDAVTKASCTTHLVQKTSDAVQMFLFQNNRGKKPTNLEIIKAEFMYQIHLHGEGRKDELLKCLTERFGKIYRNIASLGNKVDEDDILLYTLRVYFNSLSEEKPVARINDVIAKGEEDSKVIEFINLFTLELENSFDHLKNFITDDAYQSFIVLTDCKTWAMPFILKAYQFNLPSETIGKLCSALENILLRHTLTCTRGELNNQNRLGGVFKSFTEENSSIDGIIDFIEKLKGKNDIEWLNHWNNDNLKEALKGGKVGMGTAKYILWRYENDLRNQRHKGYPFKYDSITPNTEHIAPKTEPTQGGKKAGYDKYNDDFKERYLDSIGNYLLISEEHNKSIGNNPFSEKRKDYTHLEQQREIQDLTKEDMCWNKKKIKAREEKLIKFIMRILQ